MTNQIKGAVDEIGRLYPAVYRRFHVSHQPIRGSDVTPKMVWLLQHLAASGPLTIGEQMEHLGLSKAATTELVDRLERKGFIERVRDERDRRRVFVWLTDTGLERARAHPKVLADELLRRAVRRMRPIDRQHLIEGLQALLAASNEEQTDE